MQDKEELKRQVDAITQENASLKASSDNQQAELNSALLRVSAVHHRSAELEAQLVQQSTDLSTLQQNLTETAHAKDRALEVSLFFCLFTRFLFLQSGNCNRSRWSLAVEPALYSLSA